MDITKDIHDVFRKVLTHIPTEELDQFGSELIQKTENGETKISRLTIKIIRKSIEVEKEFRAKYENEKRA